MAKSRAAGLFSALAELFFPQRCCFCRRLTAKDVLVCRACREKYPDLARPEQTQSLRRVERCLSPLRYAGDARRALLRYKFEERTAYAPVFADFMVKCLDENGVSCDSITWVPLSRKRLRSRGYDQARLLAEGIAAAKGWPLIEALEKQRDTKPQSGMRSRAKRQANAAGAYRALCPEAVAGKHLLLVDDIVTTGSTLSECARVLTAAGAKRITAVTAARK